MKLRRTSIPISVLIAFTAIVSVTAQNTTWSLDDFQGINASIVNQEKPLGQPYLSPVLFNFSGLNETLESHGKDPTLNRYYAEAWNRNGDELRRTGRYADANEAYDIAIMLDHSREESWYGKGLTLFDLGRYSESISAYDRAIDLNSKWALPWYGRGKSLDQLGLHEDALEAYDRAVELDLTSSSRISQGN